MGICPFSCLSQFPAPNKVTALQKKTQTNNSIALQWEAPADPHSQLYTYCVQWVSREDPQREADPQGHKVDQQARTNDSWYVVEALEPGTPYIFSVWAERSSVASSTQSLRASTGEMGPLFPVWGREGESLWTMRSEWTTKPIRPWGPDCISCSDPDSPKAHGSSGLWGPVVSPLGSLESER